VGHYWTYLVEIRVDQLAQALGPHQIANSDSATSGLGFIGRTYPAPGRADGATLRRFAILAQPFDKTVVRQNDMGILPDPELASRQQAARREQIDLFQQRLRVDDHSFAENAQLSWVQDARRNQVGHQLVAANHQGVPGVGTAAEAHHRVSPHRQDVDNFAFAFVAPLSADDDDYRHRVPRRQRE
jgi:hypothetical protein